MNSALFLILAISGIALTSQSHQNATIEVAMTRTVFHTMEYCNQNSHLSTYCDFVVLAETVVEPIVPTAGSSMAFPMPNSTIGACQGSNCVASSGTVKTSAGTINLTLATSISDANARPAESSSPKPVNSDEKEGIAPGIRIGILGLIAKVLTVFFLI